VSHRGEHAEGAAERGNDWLDGALAGWLLFIAISAGPYLWGLAQGIRWPGVLWAVAPVLAVASVFPLLRFHRIGWFLALGALALMVAHEAAALAGGSPRWHAASAFLAVHLLAAGYLIWIIPEFWPRHASDETAAPSSAAPSSDSAAPASDSAALARVAGPTPAEQALAAIHRRIVAAGSACAVTTVSVRAEAGRFGLTPATLRTEGLALYRTFLHHFLADGALSPDEERELVCLERALDLDDDGVWRLRTEAGLHGGLSPAPALPAYAAPTDAIPPAADVPSPGPADGLPADAPGIAVDGNVTTGPGDDASPVSTDSTEPGPSREFGSPEYTSSESASGSGPSESTSPESTSPESTSPGSASPGFVSAPSESASAEAASTDLASTAAGGSESIPPRGADELLDYEEHELGALLAWAGIASVPAETPGRVALTRLRALHRTSTEPLKERTCDPPLDPEERCLDIRTVQLYRLPPGSAPPAVPADVPGPVLDPRTLLDGSLERDRDLAVFQRMGACRFVLTERRLLLVAPSGQQSPLPVSRLRAVHPYRNGVEVRPQRGGPVFLAFGGGADEVAMRIDRAARDLRASA